MGKGRWKARNDDDDDDDDDVTGIVLVVTYTVPLDSMGTIGSCHEA